MLKFNYYNHNKLTHICSIQLKSPIFNSNENKEPIVKINYISYNFTNIIQNKTSLTIFPSIQNDYKVTYYVDYGNSFYVYKHDDVLEIAINSGPNVTGTIETAYPGLVKIDTYEITDQTMYTRLNFNDTCVIQENRTSFVPANNSYTIKTEQNILLFIISTFTNKGYVILIENGKIHGATDNIGTATLADGITTATFKLNENAWYIIL